MDNNLLFAAGGEFMAQVFEESFRFSFVDGGITHVKADYPENYWPSWPSSVISCIESGESEITFKESGKHFLNKPGIATAMPPGTVYHPRIISPEGAVFIWIHVKFEIMGSVDILDFYEVPIRITDRLDVDKIASLNRKLIDIKKDTSTFSVNEILEIRICGYRLLQLLLKHAVPKKNMEKQLFNCRRLKSLLDILQEDFQANWTIDRMAKITSLSRPRLHKLFKESIGQAPLEYLTSIRLAEAQRLILTSDMNMAEIAAAVGYDDPFYFSRRFKTQFGVSPSKYSGQILV